MQPNVDIVCYIPCLNEPWKICIPDVMLDTIILFYHWSLNHIGMSCLFDTINLHFYHPQLRARLQEILQTCNTCQWYKNASKNYGLLPLREATIALWYKVAILDLNGPWSIMLYDQKFTFLALTIIDTVTNYCEIIWINNKSSQHVAQQFENNWLARYPHPIQCIVDQGGEFVGYPFQYMLQWHGIHVVATTA